MKRLGTAASLLALALATGVAVGDPAVSDPLAQLKDARDPAAAHAPIVPPPTSPYEIESALKKYDEEEKRMQTELAKIEEDLGVLDERVVARGKTYFKQVRAGLLPAGGGFDELVDHAARVERTRLALTRDLDAQKTLRKRRDALSDRMTRLKVERAPLAMQREAVAKAKGMMRMADERRQSFDRAFESSSAPPDYVAIYGADVSPSDTGSSETFTSLYGRLPLPIAGRAEVKKLDGSNGGGPALELRAAGSASARSVAAGRVVFADDYQDLKITVVIDHGERHFSIYGNLERADVKVGDNVQRNAAIGPVAPRGSDGALLYFELRKDGRAVEPAPWFGL
ncbi:MAG: peptidoglycan DD-metalloendopeptidase family protein [Polyangiaceae bacterium]|nr:peptidoglycan DD-metalloendopeptidase family protein [Polyangiaceae bacterium]